MLPFHRLFNCFSIKRTARFLYLSQDVYLMMIVFLLSFDSFFLLTIHNLLTWCIIVSFFSSELAGRTIKLDCFSLDIKSLASCLGKFSLTRKILADIKIGFFINSFCIDGLSDECSCILSWTNWILSDNTINKSISTIV